MNPDQFGFGSAFAAVAGFFLIIGFIIGFAAGWIAHWKIFSQF